MRRSGKSTIVAYSLLGLFAVITVIPLYVMLSVAVDPAKDLAKELYELWPKRLALGNFIRMWHALPLAHYLFNSLIIAFGAVSLSLVVGIPAAYALSRTSIPGRRTWLFVFLATQMFSPVMIVIGAYRVLAAIHWTDSYQGLIFLDGTFYCLPFVVWITAGFMRQISEDIESAASIDGASRRTTFLRVVLPIARPAIVVGAVFAFVASWNDFAFALTIATSPAVQPLPIGIYDFIGAYKIQWNYLMAGSLVATVPVLVMFMILQRRLVGGLTAGAIK